MFSHAYKTRPHIAFVVGAAMALGACSGSPQSTVAQAQEAFEENQFRVARIHLLNAMKDDSRDPETNLLYAKLMLELGDGLAAENTLRKLSNDDIGEADRIAMLAHSAILNGQPKKALQDCGKLDRRKWTEQVYRMALWALLEQNQLNGRSDLLEEAMERHPGSADIYALGANLSMKYGAWDEAGKRAAKAVANDPESYEALIANGRVKISSGKLAEAREFYAKAAEYYPDHAVPVANMAGLDLDLGNLKRAENVIKRGLNKHPEFPFLLFQKARLLFETGKYRESNDALLAMKDGLDNFAPALILSGRVARKLGNSEYATAKFNRALFVDPGNLEAEELLKQ